MGRYSYCGYECRITACDIGAFVSISDRVMIGGATHSMADVSMSPVFSGGRNILGKNFSNHKQKPTEKTMIGNDVWIGYAAIIKSGVSIGDGAVIGMGSVVTKNVPPYSVWAGNPARQIKQRFDDKTITRLLASQWWALPDERIAEISDQFHDVDAFLDGIS
ncbi:MAG TPA: CatB-related O-acetyltransferase [Gammaproteobacteria bacterium]|nr:CatB-related O-acetyltransferase [Gammaproteobacteria bacterium]